MSAKQELFDNGFTKLGGYFDQSELQQFCSTLFFMFKQQHDKIAEYRNQPGDLTAIIERMEARDKEALYQVQKLFLSSQRLRSLFHEASMDMCADLLNSTYRCVTLLDGPALFVNRPNTDRLLYKWHSEAHYYPKRRNFLNVWLPILGNKTEENGAMSFAVGSHKHQFPFAEYTGYNKDSENKRNHFVQYEVPANFLGTFETHHCTSKPGDVYLFHKDMVHRSNPNRTKEYSFAVVARVWDPTNDLTLSGSMAATPYGGDVGRADLTVTP